MLGKEPRRQHDLAALNARGNGMSSDLDYPILMLGEGGKTVEAFARFLKIVECFPAEAEGLPFVADGKVKNNVTAALCNANRIGLVGHG